MLNPINNMHTPIFAVTKTQNSQTNPIKMNSLQSDVFVSSSANISFTSVDDTRDGRAIRELGGVPCPYTGVPMINGRELSHLNKQNLSGKSSQVIALLKPFESRMQPVNKEVFNILKQVSKKYPNQNIRQNLDLVRPEHLEIIKNQEISILDRMNEVEIPDEKDSKKIKNLLNESKQIIIEQDENYIFRRRVFMEKLTNITNSMKDKSKVEDLKTIAEELPRAHDTVSSFIVKFTQKDPRTKQEKTPWQIGYALVESSVGSIEHVRCRHPQDGSKAGANDISNYIYASRGANSLRRNTPFPEWVAQHPEIKENMQKYIDGVIKKINYKGAMKGFRAYPIIIAKTLEKESNGEIKLDTSKLKISQKEVDEALVKYGMKPKHHTYRQKSQDNKINNQKFSLIG